MTNSRIAPNVLIMQRAHVGRASEATSNEGNMAAAHAQEYGRRHVTVCCRQVARVQMVNEATRLQEQGGAQHEARHALDALDEARSGSSLGEGGGAGEGPSVAQRPKRCGRDGMVEIGYVWLDLERECGVLEEGEGGCWG